MTCNKSNIPFDHPSFDEASGIRLGTPAGTTRGFGVEEFELIGELIVRALDAAARSNGEFVDENVDEGIRREVRALCRKFPIYERL